MADNVVLNSGTGGATLAAKEVTHGGDVSQLQAVSLMGVSGTEGSYSVSDINGDATNGLDVDVTRVSGTVTVDGSGVTQPISHAALTELAAAISTEVQCDIVGALPAGTNNIGDVDVLTIAAGDNNIGNVDIVTVPAPLSTTGGGTEATALRVTIASDSTGVVSIDDNGGSLTVDGTVAVSGTVTVGSHAVTNAGTFAVQVDGSALTALQVIDNPVLVDDAAFTPTTSSVMMAGYEADEGSTDSVDEGDAGAARMTLDRKVIVNPQPHTTGGLSIFRSLDLDETEEEVKASAGQVYGWYIANLATTTRFVKFYNATAANTTVGTTTPVLTLPIPGNATDDVAANALGGMGIVFDTAITVAATSALADADTTAPGANDVVINLLYK